MGSHNVCIRYYRLNWQSDCREVLKVKNELLEAHKYLTHNIRHDLVHFRIYKRECEKLILHIEETLKTYLKMIEVLEVKNEPALSDGKNSKVE